MPSARYVIITTRYGGVGIYDFATRKVAAFFGDVYAEMALRHLLAGTESPEWRWRDAYPSEEVSAQNLRLDIHQA
jgi:hypothetical protein